MKEQSSTGVIAALLSFVLWGILPIYWKALNHVPALEILCHRIVWAMVFLGVLVHYKKGWKGVWALAKNRKKQIYLSMSTTLVACNWYLYIWAVNNHHILQASLGYYINPLMNIFFGIFLFNETLTKKQWGAIALAFAAVSFLTFSRGVLPTIALVVAITFCLYGAIHKRMASDAIDTLFVETALLSLPSLIYLLCLPGGGHYVQSGWSTAALLMGAGVVTATPLLLFVYAMNKVKLATLGFLQYISPTGQFICGILLFGEHLDQAWIITYVLIWAAVILYLVSDLKRKQLRSIKNPEL